MKRTNSQPLKEALQDYIKALKMAPKLKEVRLVGSWERVVGKTINRATRDIYIKERKLFVTLNSSVVRNELFNIRELLVKRLNEEVGGDVIDDISLK